MTRDEALDIITKLQLVLTTEEEGYRLMDRLRDAFPHSGIIDLIFQDMRNLTAEQVVEEAYQREKDHAKKTQPQ